jgi:hypothetical protein
MHAFTTTSTYQFKKNFRNYTKPPPSHSSITTTLWSNFTVAVPSPLCLVVFGRRKRGCMQILCNIKKGEEDLQLPAFLAKPALYWSPLTLSTILLDQPEPLHGPHLTQTDITHSPLGYKLTGHPSPSFLAHSAPLTLPYQFLRPDLKLSTCAAKENEFHDQVL